MLVFEKPASLSNYVIDSWTAKEECLQEVQYRTISFGL